MHTALPLLLNLYVFPTGRRLFAHQQAAARAKALGVADLSKHCAAAIAHDRACLDLERRWDGMVADAAKKVPKPAGMLDPTVVDSLVDRTLTAIRDTAVAQADVAEPGDPIHETAATFLKAIFPAGVAQVTSQPYVEELETVDRIVNILEKEQAPAVKELSLGRLAKRLAVLAVDYRAALQAKTSTDLTFAEVRAARQRGQELLLETVARVLGKHPTSSAADLAARDDLLAAIVEQNQAIAATLRGRRGPAPDVHPDTGVPTGTPTSDASTPAIAGKPVAA